MVVSASPRVAVVIPSYRVTRHVLGVIERIGPEVARIYVVDDACPAGSGDHVATHGTDPRVRVIRHAENGGVGAAVVVVGAAVVTGVRTVVVGDSVVVVAGDVVLRTQPRGHFLAKRWTCTLPRTIRTHETC